MLLLNTEKMLKMRGNLIGMSKKIFNAHLGDKAVDFTLKEISRGGNCCISEIVSVSLDELKEYEKGSYVIKCLIQEKKNTERKERLLKEIKILCKLKNNEGVVHVNEYDENKDNPWYIMSKMEPLLEFLSDAKSLSEKIGILINLAKSLKSLHDQKISHRDIKPDNILVNSFGKPIWADFGIAYQDEFKRITADNKQIGPRGYISNEIGHKTLMGDSSFDVYRMADIKSFSKLISAICGDNSPLEGTYAQHYKILSEQNKGKDLSILLDIIEKGTDLTPENRCTIDEIISGLENFYSYLNSSERYSNQIKILAKAFSSSHSPSYLEYNEEKNIKELLLLLKNERILINLDDKKYSCAGLVNSENIYYFYEDRQDGQRNKYYFKPRTIKIEKSTGNIHINVVYDDELKQKNRNLKPWDDNPVVDVAEKCIIISDLQN